jgi:NAD(P)-dependent dehydrogenase (short-subunit alcohol dehydrogenase family)
VNNAGREERCAPPFELTWTDYQKMIDLNLKAIYNTVGNRCSDE